MRLVFVLVVLGLLNFLASGTLYKRGDDMVVYASKVGPFNNPSEIYLFYDKFPFCVPEKIIYKKQGLGATIEGDKKVNTLYHFDYLESFSRKTVCKKKFKGEDIAKLKTLVASKYYYEFDFDGLRSQNLFGYYEEEISTPYIYTHILFKILYNPRDESSGHIIYFNVTSDPSSFVSITDDEMDIEFKYSVSWNPVDIKYQFRNHYSIKEQIKTENVGVHWLSILNSCILVLLLIGFITMLILRTLRKDYALFEDDENDYGWKVIGRDVFRTPSTNSWTLLTALIGVGAQFFIVSIFVLILAIIGIYYPGNDGSLFVSLIVLYAFTSAAAGYLSNNLHVSWGGNQWVHTTILSVVIFALPFYIIAFVANMVAVLYQTTNALPFGSIIKIIAIWLFVGFPLAFIGAMVGKRTAKEATPPVKPKTLARQMPSLPIFASLPFKMAVAGFLPFSSIYIELFYLFDAIWGFGDYQLWGILFVVFFILVIVTSCISIALTYFQISNEDYRWWWHSYLNGASTGIYIYGYALFYFSFNSEMQGFLQVIFYFGYSFIICYFFSLMLGTVSFFASFIFMKRIYKAIPTK